MSSTNRGGQRNPADYYPTPAWCVDRLLDAVALPGGRWVEPAAGDGAIIRAVNARVPGVAWTCHELRAECEPALLALPGVEAVHVGSYLHTAAPLADVIITNPPFSLARDFVAASLPRARYVAMLLRLNFLSSGERANLMRSNAPDVYVLPNRPSFSGGGRTDSVEYAWFVWPEERGRSAGKVQVLAETPAAVRCARPRARSLLGAFTAAQQAQIVAALQTVRRASGQRLTNEEAIVEVCKLLNAAA
jgi:hypothetical protein